MGAKKGYELLKKKSDALKVRFRDIMKEIAKTKGNMAEQVREYVYVSSGRPAATTAAAINYPVVPTHRTHAHAHAALHPFHSMQGSSAFFSLTQAQYAAGDFRQQVLQGSLTASVRVHTHTDNVAGVKLPVFRQYEIQSEVKSKAERDQLGLAQGGRQIKACKEKFSIFLTNLVKLASLQTSFITLDEALKVSESVRRLVLGESHQGSVNQSVNHDAHPPTPPHQPDPNR